MSTQLILFESGNANKPDTTNAVAFMVQQRGKTATGGRTTLTASFLSPGVCVGLVNV